MPDSHPTKQVISASRRTDIPAFYLDWFFGCLEAGSFRLTNPFNGRVRTVRVSPETTAAVVFWSKDYGPLLESLRRLSGWRCVFNFTVNSPDGLLEPETPPLEVRLEQMRRLCGLFGPDAVCWRFDPVTFYRAGGETRDNLHAFDRLLDFAARLGISRCTVSFMDRYRKIDRRQRRVPGFEFVYPETARLADTAADMASRAAGRGIRLFTCCEPELAEAGIDNLEPGRCIDHELIERLYGVDAGGRRDRGQRTGSGCLCHRSVDIGSYREQPCRCDCLYCYANPSVDRKEPQVG